MRNRVVATKGQQSGVLRFIIFSRNQTNHFGKDINAHENTHRHADEQACATLAAPAAPPPVSSAATVARVRAVRLSDTPVLFRMMTMTTMAIMAINGELSRG